MTKHLFGLVLTPHGVAANNRGATEGNTTTLQKLVWRGETHTTVSAEAIRTAIRRRWQEQGLRLNRTWDDDLLVHQWKDPAFTDGGQTYVDDDVLGFMAAEGAKQEADADDEGEAEPAPRRGRGRQRGTTRARRARLEVTRAVSLDPWPGDVSFNAASPGATLSAARRSETGVDYPVPYAAEFHSTRYQYGFALTPTALYDPSRATLVLDAILDLGRVAGNHARFLFDFSPESLVLRWTDDPAPRFLYAFDLDGDTVRLPRLVHLVEVGDVRPEELWVAGSVATGPDGARLGSLGARVLGSVREAVDGVKRLVTSSLP